mmetsp:Transcript_1727/g.2061  ORF Transcript_1727/g.2061 Transcript_1727/m.2061 type:complete len:205 (-) Transcript_1727:503-1117(-)
MHPPMTAASILTIDQEHETNKNIHMMHHQVENMDLITCTTEMPTKFTNAADVSTNNLKKDESESSSLPPSPTCTSSHPSSDEFKETMERLSEFSLYGDDQLGFDFSSEHDSTNDVSDFNDLPMHIGDESLSTSRSQGQPPALSILSSKPYYSQTKEDDELFQKKSRGERTVRFSSCLVTGIYTRPRTSEAEWHEYYYSGHELQR